MYTLYGIALKKHINKYHAVGTVLKFNWTIVETETKSMPLKSI